MPPEHPDAEELKRMCFYCFDTLAAHLTGSARIRPDFRDTEYPLFVTWTVPTNRHRLRGCIGNFHAMTLHHGLAEYALQSGIHDTRFDPIQVSELNKLNCEVSLLVNFENASRWNDWEIGKHGIRISLHDGNTKYASTYLPEVAREQGWDHRKTLSSLLAKGGYKGSVDDDVLERVHVVRYQSINATVTYPDYVKYKTQNPSQ